MRAMGGTGALSERRVPVWKEERREQRASREQSEHRPAARPGQRRARAAGGAAGRELGGGAAGSRREGGMERRTDGRTDGQGRPWARCPSRVSHSQPRTVCQAQPEERPRSAQTLNPRSLASPQHPASLPSSQEEKPALKSSKA